MKLITILLVILLAIFILIRLPGIHVPYHQDEIKWVTHSTTIGDSNTGKGQPPLSGIIFPVFGKILGADNMRVLPLFFGALNLILIYLLVRDTLGRKEAYWVAVLFSITFYSFLSSLMIDIDGQFLPFFVLITFVSFFKWAKSDDPRKKLYWLLCLIASALLGFMTKLNFIIPALALFLFYVSDIKVGIRLSVKNLVKLGIVGIGIIAVVISCFFGARYIFPSFNLDRVFSHALDYFSFRDRNFGQIIFQACKALFYSSPLLVAPLALLRWEEIKKLKLYIIFLGIGFVFYFVIFDFSGGALDKYLSFVIIPLTIISGFVLANRLSESTTSYNNKIIAGGSVVILLIFLSQFLPHSVPALYPKNEWISRVVNFKWNFVVPFTGGSGPLGFYVSFLFISLVWTYSFILIFLASRYKNQRAVFLTLMVCVGLVYNAVFVEEYTVGKINGNSTVLLERAVSFINSNEQIGRVITYNDIGGYELAKLGKYERRIYVAPKYDTEHINTLNNFKGFYLLIDIPHLSTSSIYAKYFSTCRPVYSDQSEKISSKVYDCKNALNLKGP